MIIEVDPKITDDNVILSGGEIIKYFAIEEMSEFTKELSKDLRGKLDKEHFIEELADVYYVLSMIKRFYLIQDEDINKNIRLKMIRSKAKIEEMLSEDEMLDRRGTRRI